MIFKSGTIEGDLNGFLDKGSRFEGELRFEATFRVDGKLSGKVVSEGSLVVGEGGEIDGEIRVGELFISGTVRGDVYTTKRVQLAPKGRVFGDLYTPSLIIEDGAQFDGRCAMSRDADGTVAKLVPPRSQTKGA